MKSILAACSLGLAAQLVSPALAQQANSNQFGTIDKDGRVITINSPLRVADRDVRPIVTPLSFDDLDFDIIADADRVTMLGFPLNRTTTIDLELEAFEVFTKDAVRVSGTPTGDVPTRTGNIQLFRGSVVGIEDSWVYLAISPTMNNGIIEIEGTTHIITNGDFIQNTGMSIYNMSDLPEGEIDWIEYACTVIDVSPPPEGGGGGGTNIDDQPCRIARMAIEGDNELSDKFGTDPIVSEENTNMYIESLVGGVSQIYITTWNLEIQIAYSRIWPGGENANPDEWTGTNTPAALTELRALWSSPGRPFAGVWHGVHLLSGKPLGGGIAYLRAICNEDIAMAVSGNLNGVFPDPLVDNHAQNWDITVTAHEWGHNFGAPHTHGLIPFVDACGFGDCSQAEFGTIMSYCHTCPGGMENIALTFADRIISEGILPYVTLQMPCDLEDLTGTGCTDGGFDCPADVNGDGKLDGRDFTAWIVAYNTGDLAADLNRNGTLEPADFSAWLASWRLGCE